MSSLSVLVVVHNEEKQLKECLQTISFADEIVVVLDKCNDKSKEISSKFTKNIYSGKWDIEGERRNFGLKKCTKEWIFEIDADERVPSSLRKEIIKTIKVNKKDWFHIKLNNFVGKNIVSYGWGAYIGKSAYAGLFRNGKKKWGLQRVHPKIILKGEKGIALRNHLDHYYCQNIDDLFLKLNTYSSLRALDLKDNHSNETLSKNILRLFSRFWKSYFLRKGYKEKNYGVIIAIIAALYPLISYLKFKNYKL